MVLMTEVYSESYEIYHWNVVMNSTKQTIPKAKWSLGLPSKSQVIGANVTSVPAVIPENVNRFMVW